MLPPLSSNPRLFQVIRVIPILQQILVFHVMYSLSVEFHISSTCTSFLAAYYLYTSPDDFPCRTLHYISTERYISRAPDPKPASWVPISPCRVPVPAQQKHKNLYCLAVACYINLRLPFPQWLRTVPYPKKISDHSFPASLYNNGVSRVLESFSLYSLVRGKLPTSRLPFPSGGSNLLPDINRNMLSHLVSSTSALFLPSLSPHQHKLVTDSPRCFLHTAD